MTYLAGHKATDIGVTSRKRLNEANVYDRTLSIHDAFRDRAQASPDAVAIVAGEDFITYADLDRLTDALAGFLVDQGIKKGDIVGLAVPRALSTVVAQLAILKAGGLYLPIDPAFPVEHLNYVIEECSPKVIFTDDAHRERIRGLSGLRGRVIDLPALLPTLDMKGSQSLPFVSGGDGAYVMYTSGSTGRPKGVLVPHRGVTRLVLDQGLSDTCGSDVVLHTATISFDASTFEVWSALLNGATLAVMPKASFALSDLFEVMRDKGVTIALLTTGLFNLFADHADGHLPALRHMLFGGEVASVAHVHRFQQVFPGRKLTNAYGPTEASCIAAIFDVPEHFQGEELPIGKAIAEIEAIILDEYLQPVATGMEGQLALSGDALALGYFGRSELTRERFVNVDTAEGPVRCYLTGDQAVRAEDGNLFFKGRHDRQIKINGKRIELDEIEAAIRRDPKVLDSAVVCHDLGGSIKRVVAYLRVKDEKDVDNSSFLPTVMERLRNTLPPYMVPNVAVALKSFPLTPAGKVDRSSLPPPPEERAKPVSPESRSEKIIADLWRSALGIKEAPLDRNFFDLGGTSLQLLKIHANLEAELGRNLDVFALFKHPTIRELARFLDGEAGQSARSMAIAERARFQRGKGARFRRSTT